MKCPHCQVEIHGGFEHTRVTQGFVGIEDGEATAWIIKSMQCPAPACRKAILICEKRHNRGVPLGQWFVYPQNSNRPTAAVEVPEELAEDFNEAGKVLEDSPKASAALTRRCLQTLLRLQGFTNKDLAPAISELLNSKQLPSWLSTNVDAIRNIGNFAAHPMKDTNSGAILPVEPHEAEWNLEVLEGLFDFYYVQPAKDEQRRLAFNAKLQLAGKPPLKQ